MKARSFMLIAGEPSGDVLGAELVTALREQLDHASTLPSNDLQPLQTSLEPHFFGAGGPRMAAAGVDLIFDLTAHSVIGLADVLKKYLEFRRLFRQLHQLALERQPDTIICIDFAGFNRRFAKAIRQWTRPRTDWFHDWHPRLVQYVSPQVWASREGRAWQMARDYDLLLSIFPFEKGWYAKRLPRFHVEFVGHPIADRYSHLALTRVRPKAVGDEVRSLGFASKGPIDQRLFTSSPVTDLSLGQAVTGTDPRPKSPPTILLLPGSRSKELTHHLPVMLGALAELRAAVPGLRGRMVLPSEVFVEQARNLGVGDGIDVRAGGLPQALAEADLAIASTGTVTLECAYFGVPTVALYRISWPEYEIGKRLVKVRYIAMPNLLAGEALFPEFIQQDATPHNIARAGLELLRNESLRSSLKARLAGIIGSLGGPGASRRAARAILGCE
jgi:lipid-A-disaccharide synthase